MQPDLKMKFTRLIAIFSVATIAGVSVAASLIKVREDNRHSHITAPKVFIITLFTPERDAWLNANNTANGFGTLLLQKNITVPGFSPIFPDAHCLQDGSVCLLTTGESEINAASTMSALSFSPLFDLRKTYFLISGIGGVNPKHGTINDVAFSKYAVQVALQYEIDARELPEGYGTGYIPQGSHYPNDYPSSIYGTEVFEINEDLRDIAVQFASKAILSDTAISSAYRQNYAGNDTAAFKSPYTEALRTPKIITCDVVTSDVYFSGQLLAESFENTTTLFTNGSGTYCMTAQEDNAILASLLRGAQARLLDFGRIIIMRAGSDFDRPYPGSNCLDNLFSVSQGAFQSALHNLFLAGSPVVQGILSGWRQTFSDGVKARNYIGDIFGSLGGKPDFGPGSEFDDNPVQSRDLVHKDSIAGRVGGKGKRGARIARRANGNA